MRLKSSVALTVVLMAAACGAGPAGPGSSEELKALEGPLVVADGAVAGLERMLGRAGLLRKSLRAAGHDPRRCTAASQRPYSTAGLDLRAQPVVLTVPPVEQGRYFSVQLIELYTHDFDYLGSRAPSNANQK